MEDTQNDSNNNESLLSNIIPSFQDQIISCDEKAKKGPYHIVFNPKNKSNENIFQQSDLYEIRVERAEESWQIHRKYEDFEWLFKIMMNRFPGSIFPYFPTTKIQTYLEDKAKQLNIKLHNCFYAPRQQQIVQFLKSICSNKIWLGQQLEYFLGNEFQNKKKETKHSQLNSNFQSKFFSVLSFLTRNLSWFSNQPQLKSDDTNQLLKIRCHVATYSSQILFLLQKFNDFITSKTSEINCSDGETEIDSIQILRAKMVSSKPFNQKLIADIESQILVRLIQELKKQGQIQEQIRNRVQLGQLLEHLRKADEKDERINHLLLHIKEFDSTMLEQWPRYDQEWKETVGDLDNRFRQIWMDYCEKMSKIWR